MAVTRHSFVLKGAAQASNIAGDLADGTNCISLLTQKKQSLLGQRLTDDSIHEQMLMGRRTIVVPSFQLINEQGVEYPSTSDEGRWCQWDHYPFTWRPLGMPIQRIKVGTKINYVCKRYFCSLECVLAFYMHEHIHDGELTDQVYKNIEEMHTLILKDLNQPYEKLERAQDWNLLKLVGSGSMDIDEFRSLWKTKYTKEFAFVMLKGLDVYVKHS